MYAVNSECMFWLSLLIFCHMHSFSYKKNWLGRLTSFVNLKKRKYLFINIRYFACILHDCTLIYLWWIKAHYKEWDSTLVEDTGAWGMDFVSSSPLFPTTPLFQNFHIKHFFLKFIIIVRFSSFDNISRRHTSWIIHVFCVHSISTDTV